MKSRRASGVRSLHAALAPGVAERALRRSGGVNDDGKTGLSHFQDAGRKAGFEVVDVEAIAALERVTYTGVSGPYRMSPGDHNGLSTFSIVVTQIENGKFTVAK